MSSMSIFQQACEAGRATEHPLVTRTTGGGWKDRSPFLVLGISFFFNLVACLVLWVGFFVSFGVVLGFGGYFFMLFWIKQVFLCPLNHPTLINHSNRRRGKSKDAAAPRYIS